MVRDNTTIYAEVNDEDTVIVDETSPTIMNDGLIIGKGNKSIAQKVDAEEYGVILYLSEGIVQELPIIPNKRLGTDADGNLAWV